MITKCKTSGFNGSNDMIRRNEGVLPDGLGESSYNCYIWAITFSFLMLVRSLNQISLLVLVTIT